MNEFHAIFPSPCFVSDRPSMFWWLSPGEGLMPSHEAVGVNCRNGATTEYQGSGIKYMG